MIDAVVYRHSNTLKGAKDTNVIDHHTIKLDSPTAELELCTLIAKVRSYSSDYKTHEKPIPATIPPKMLGNEDGSSTCLNTTNRSAS
ncbi:hypothetical protein [Pseudoalteromonas obscura]|uniref:Uncharacterized protein n=1 Tax=Pseudoalteromonas obscura TaxID=3048491 RepID=A0ABT7EK52_9GAMM|nr:hypothetical protein [Pseudoalteromonas sp. P94(2023)]MDK2595429.1 hypothetical protein [Pseudoalteromonas sp. P94(2023)]